MNSLTAPVSPCLRRRCASAGRHAPSSPTSVRHRGPRSTYFRLKSVCRRLDPADPGPLTPLRLASAAGVAELLVAQGQAGPHGATPQQLPLWRRAGFGHTAVGIVGGDSGLGAVLHWKGRPCCTWGSPRLRAKPGRWSHAVPRHATVPRFGWAT